MTIEELVMFRPAYYGGLEVHNVKYKALAALTRTFLETACNPSFQRSLFHSNLFRFHVLNDTSIPNPGLPPFYSVQFFRKIRQVHLETPLNITTMTEKQWYRLYLEDFCTMETLGDGEGQGHFIPTRIEENSPTTDWENSGCCWSPGRGSTGPIQLQAQTVELMNAKKLKQLTIWNMHSFPVLPTRMWGKQSFMSLVSNILTSLLRPPFV
jgi:hypothetical protein